MPAERTKQRRSTRACDFCHSRGTRCRQNSDDDTPGVQSCKTCVEFGETCTWNRAPRKRGTKPGTSSTKKAALWIQKVQENRTSIASLIDVYLETIHPVFPLYCERELWVRWRESKFPATSSEYASLIAMCALSAQHAQQGSLFETDEPHERLTAHAEPYLKDAIDSVRDQQLNVLDLELIRVCGFLALFGIQTGNRSLTHKHLGIYHGICAQFGLHDESQWDGKPNMSGCELEVRRRLFWAMYRLEVHSASVLGHMVRLPENQSNVEYPMGLHHPAFISGRDGDFEDWFAGWNTTTDLYRILEYAIIEFRASRRQRVSISAQSTSKPMSEASLHQRLMGIQAKALPQFDQIHDKSSDSGRNRCGFQATNILFTIHMIRMFLATGSPARMLEAAETLLDSAKKIPSAYIRASGVRLLQDLAGTGLMLGATAAQASTVPDQAKSLVNVQNALAGFLDTMAAANETARSLTNRLREQITQINLHLTFIGHADSTNVSSEKTRNHIWDQDICKIFQFDQYSHDTSIMPTHFQSGFLMNFP